MFTSRAFRYGAIAVLACAAAATAQIVEYTINVGDSPNALAVDSTDHTVYVVCEGIDSVYVLDGDADAPEQAVIAKIPVEDYPVDVTWNPVDNTMWVVNKQINSPTGSVTVINASNNTTITSVGVGAKPIKAVWASVGNKMYTLEREGGTITAIDCATNTVVGTIWVPDEDYGFADIAYNPNMDRLYVAAPGVGSMSGKFYVIDCTVDQIIRTLDVARGPQLVAVSPYENRVFSVSNDQRTMNVIDCETNTIVGYLPYYTQDPTAIIWSTTPVNRIWLACGFGHAIHYMRADLLALEGQVNTPEKKPVALLYNPYTTKVFAANELTHDVTVVNGRIPGIIVNIDVGNGPKDMALYERKNRVYVANYWERGPGTVTVLKDFIGIEESPGRQSPLPTRATPSPVGAGNRIMLQAAGFQPTRATLVDATGRTVYEGGLGRDGAVAAPGEPGVYFYTVTDGRLTSSGKFAVR